MKEKVKILCASSLDKIFADKGPKLVLKKASAFLNEPYNFQVSFYSERIHHALSVEVESELSEYITVRVVEPVPVGLSQKKGENDSYIIKKRGDITAYPDILQPLRNGQDIPLSYAWKTYYVRVNGDGVTLQKGEYPITVIIKDGEKELARTTFTLTLYDAVLPKQDVIYTNWMHYDGIAKIYRLEPFSDEYYEIFNTYLETAVKHGMNMLYTPMFTPPLDTYVGGERLTVQLVGVEKNGVEYKFNFDKLERFIENALSIGTEYFELSHIATQWGAKCCPKIIATVDGEEKKIFGWETSSTGEEYLYFLDCYLGALREFVDKKGYGDKIYFHISDEPHWNAKDNFLKIREVLAKHFPSLKLMDALHNYEFYENDVINTPVVASDFVKTFVEHDALRWVYYCSWERKDFLSNRFLNMPLQRTRIMGIQLYRNCCEGLLHWGYNFYNCGGSVYLINPFLNPDSGGTWEAGDAYVVYPGLEGALDSIRHEAMGECFNDYRALKLYESLVGKEAVMSLLKKNRIEGFSKYPRSAKWHIRFREDLNALIMNAIIIKEINQE